MSSETGNTDTNRSLSSIPQIEEFLGAKDEKSVLSLAAPTSYTSKDGNEAPPGTPSHLTAVGSTVCRICHTNTVNEHLISPCYCKGSMGYVHLSCLERWLNQSSRDTCELCMYKYDATQTQRYGLCEGLRLWIRHPRNRSHVQSDILISVLLTVVTAGLVSVCLMGMQYFVLEGKRIGISKTWARGIIGFFLGVVILGYGITVYLLIKDQLVPWYNWWRSTVDVRLRLSPSIRQGLRPQVRETNV